MTVKCGSCGEFLADLTNLTDDHKKLACANKSCRLSGLSPTRISMPKKFGAELIKVLGLDGQRVRGVTIAFKVDQPIVLTVEHLASEAQAGGLVQLLSQYDVNLSPADLPAPDAPSVSITQTVGDLAAPEQIQRCRSTAGQLPAAETAGPSPTEASPVPTLQEIVREEVAAQLKAHFESVAGGFLRMQTYGRGCGL